MKNLGKKELIILLTALIVFIGSVGFFVARTIIEKSTPTVKYRVYTKEDGWSKWCKNGEICGNDHYITALQINVKSNKKGFVYYNVMANNKWSKKDKENNEIIGDMKNPIQSIKIKTTDTLVKKYKLSYRISDSKKDWFDYGDGYLEMTYKVEKDGPVPVKYIQIKIDER